MLQKIKENFRWPIALQIIIWSIIFLLYYLSYNSIESYSNDYCYGPPPRPGDGAYIAMTLARILSYNIYEFALFTLACIIFVPWFAVKGKSVNLRFIYLATVLLLSRAVIIYQTLTSKDIYYTEYQYNLYFLILEMVCVCLLFFVGYRFYKELKRRQTYMLTSRILIFIGLVFLTFTTFNDRRKMIAAIKTRKISYAERLENGINWADLNYIKYLFARDANLKTKIRNNYNPLMEAVRNSYHTSNYFTLKNLEVINYFLKMKPDLSLKDKYGNTALSLAVLAGKPAVVKLLIDQGSDINVRNKSGHAPLTIALMNKNKKIAELLKKHGATIKKEELNNIVFINYCRSDKPNLSIIEKYLKKGVNPDFKDIKGNTVLIHAVENENKDLIKLLLQFKADVNVRDKNGKAPLLYARSVETAQLLINAGANIKSVDNEGKSLIMRTTQPIDVVNFLLSSGVDANIIDNTGSTALHNEYNYANYKRFKILLSQGINPNIKNHQGKTAFMDMRIYRKDDILKIIDLLAEHDANFNIQDNDGRTMLMHYVFLIDTRVVNHLLNKNLVDVNVKDKDGKTALDYAQEMKKNLNWNKDKINQMVNALEKASANNKGTENRK